MWRLMSDPPNSEMIVAACGGREKVLATPRNVVVSESPTTKQRNSR